MGKLVVTIEYWVETYGGADNQYTEVEADTLEEALDITREENKLGKLFRVYAIKGKTKRLKEE